MHTYSMFSTVYAQRKKYLNVVCCENFKYVFEVQRLSSRIENMPYCKVKKLSKVLRMGITVTKLIESLWNVYESLV